MVIAADYPFLDVLWTMVLFFAWLSWFWILVGILGDVFRRRDIGGGTKAAWVVFLIVLPFLGVLVYLIAQHEGMTERQFDGRVRSVAGDGAATEIEKAEQLLARGSISQGEFDALKSRALTAH